MEDEIVVSRVAQRLLDDTRAELTRADDKASSALGAVSALVAVVAVTPSGLRPSQEVVTWGWVCGLSICVLAMVLLMLAALPRFTTGSQRQVLAYVGDVSRVRHERDLDRLVGQLAERPSEAVLSELRAISKIGSHKVPFYAVWNLVCGHRRRSAHHERDLTEGSTHKFFTRTCGVPIPQVRHDPDDVIIHIVGDAMGCPTNNTARDDNGHGEWGPETFVGRLRPAERHALLALGGLTLHPAGGHLLEEGDRSRFVLILHGGPVKVVVYDTSGREHLLGLRGRGDLLGELSYLDNQPRSASVVTLRQVYATTISAERFSRFFEEHSRVGIELTRYVGERLRDADRSRLELSTDDVTLRVTRLLRNLAHRPMADSIRRGAVIPLTQGQLAQLAHAAEVTVHRVLRKFKTRGIVRTAYRSIEVPCVMCLDLLLAQLSVERRDRNDIRGCDGRESHRSR